MHFVRPLNAFTIGAAVNTNYASDAALNQHELLPRPVNLPDDMVPSTSVYQTQPTRLPTCTELPSQDDPNKKLEIHVGQWYAVHFEEFNYWYVGIVELKNESGTVQLNFLEQKEIGKNMFSSSKVDTHIVDSKDAFYKLQDAPTPISLSRSTTMTLMEEDFNTIENIFKVKYPTSAT